jgi:transposase
VRERAVALVWETQSDYGSQWEAIVSIAEKVGVSAESLRRWVRQAEIDAGRRAGTTSGDAEALRELRRENRDLRRANEILKAAATFMPTRRLCRQPVVLGGSWLVRWGVSRRDGRHNRGVVVDASLARSGREETDMSTRRTSSPSGSLVRHGPGFRGYLFERGHSASAAHKHLQLLADLSRWLEREGICADELAAASAEEFCSSVAGAPRAGRTCARHARWTRCWPTCVSWT